MAKKKRRKLNIVRTLIFILIIYIIVCFGMYLYDEPVRHFEISGNEFVKDADIMRAAGLDKYPPYVTFFTGNYSKKIEKLSLVSKAHISYGFNFTIKIAIEENTPLLLDKTTDEVILKDGSKIAKDEYVGLPILLNQTPEKVLKNFLENFSKVDKGIRYMVNEVEYTPSYSASGDVIDEYRFLLSMNDQNMVYVNGKNADRLNKYLDIISTNKIKVKGTLYLDGDENRYPFKYETTNKTTKKTKKAGKHEN